MISLLRGSLFSSYPSTLIPKTGSLTSFYTEFNPGCVVLGIPIMKRLIIEKAA